MSSAHSYSLTPLNTAHTAYLFRDQETGAQIGFGLLTRARVEGERFKLRELDENSMGLIEEMFKKVADVGKSIQQDENAIEDLKTTADDSKNSYTATAIIKAKGVVKDLVNDLVNKRILVDSTSAYTESNYAMMTAGMTPSELVDELLFGLKKKDEVTNKPKQVVKKKLKKKRLIHSPGPTRYEPKSGKDSKLQLPPGWDRLSPAQLAEQMKTLNSLDEESPDYGRISRVVDKMGQEPSQEERQVEETVKPVSEKQRFRKRKREALRELNKSNLSNPMKLPRNWDQCSPESLAAQLKSKVDINGNSLTKVLENLENVSKVNNRQAKVSNFQLPANWAESDPQSLAENIKSSTLSAGNPDLGKILDKLQNKKAAQPARKTAPILLPANWEEISNQDLAANIQAAAAPGQQVSGLLARLAAPEVRSRAPARKTGHIVLPANWEEISNQDLAANIQAAAAPGQQVSGLLARLAAPVERSRTPCPGTRQAREEHVRLPADWEESLSRPADLADKIKAVNSDKNIPPALLDRLRKEDHKSFEKKIRSDEAVRLPANWEDSLYSSPADLADKIRAVNSGRNVPPALLDRLRREDHRSVQRKVKVGSSTRPLVLPHNWHNSSSRELSRKLKAKLSKTSASSKRFSELFSRLDKKRSQTEEKSVKSGPVKLPADWATSSSQELLEKISSCQNVDQVCLSKIKANMTRPRAVETDKAQSSAVILPSNWESSPEDLRKALEEKKSNNQEIDKVLQNLKKRKDPLSGVRISKKRTRCRAGRVSRGKVLSKRNDRPDFKLPADWSTCNASELVAKISSSNVGQNSESLEKIIANLQRSGNLRQDPPPGQSAPVRLPANWSNCSSQMLVENFSKQNLNPQILSTLLTKLQRVQQPELSDKRLKFKKSKNSKRRDTADPKPNTVKLPANWENASRQQLAESLKMQNMDASVKSTLLANLARTKQPNQGSMKPKSSDKHARNRTGHSKAANAVRREVNTKKAIQLPPGWETISPDILAQELRTGQSSKEGLGKVIENLQTQKKESEKAKEGIKKRKVVHQKQTKQVHKKIRIERKQLEKERRNNQKKKSIEFSTVLKISEEEKVRLLKPAQFGWRRECFVGVTGARLTPEGALVKEKIRIDIYYWPPSTLSQGLVLPANLKNKELQKLGGKRIKNIQEMKKFLENNNIERKTGITLENFSFKAKILDLGDFEYLRYTEHARQHLAERERVKQARKNDAGWVVEHLEDVNNDLSEVTQRPEDLFGDISDLEDDFEDMEEELPRTTEENLSSRKIKEALNCAEDGHKGSSKMDSIKEGVLQSVELEQDSSGLKDIENTCQRNQEGTTDHQKSKVKKKEKERITLVVESIDLQLRPLSLSVKPKRPVSQALHTFCTKYKLEMEDLQFWCGERRLGGGEKNSSLDERKITVSLAPARRKAHS